ncbi:unnamed protein product [Lupinus luteus]|uniref:Reverse transcriptase zinc-binding domain-containing protein n=1 Tax=Lupinus luteus TaxID=3873 RepID=A0AAV1YHN5_LUPLU
MLLLHKVWIGCCPSKVVEDVNHLFLSCTVSSGIWSAFYAWIGHPGPSIAATAAPTSVHNLDSSAHVNIIPSVEIPADDYVPDFVVVVDDGLAAFSSAAVGLTAF